MKNLCVLLMVFTLFFSCKKNDEEKISGVVSKKTEVIKRNAEKEISKQVADFDKDKFYERSFLLDWDFFIPKGRYSNFLPSSYSYAKRGVSHKSLIVWKVYTEYGMGKVLQSYANEGERGGKTYTKEDIGKKLLVAGYKYDEQGCLVSSIEPILYGEGGQMETVYEYDSYNRCTALYSRVVPEIDLIPYSEEYYKKAEKCTIIQDDLREYIPINKKNDILECKSYYVHSDGKKDLISTIKEGKTEDYFFYNNQKVLLINNRLEEIKNENGVWKFLYNEYGQILEAVQTANNKVKEKFFDAKYKNGELIESKYYDGRLVIKTVYKKYDNFGDWVEADIYYNNDKNCSFTIFRDFEYYD
ncbi:hypothetical protein E4O05_09460 [Treponema sp. OMZ 787]|uniref:hypothetical protein n=1 Tax=Treponema sp. OMZ 787 TaxID=2563669 RepID=UPI0020A5F800|nr:hypothetical protein [Treponema sp. OMZ 787]UTC61761.1 hypothetical protein E4O05_09460 [Treponema sp. OMZ 787]